MRTEADLEDELRRIDGRGYPAYKDLRGAWDLGDMVLHIDRVQGDPFAAPSHVRVVLDPEVAELPDWALSTPGRRVSCGDFLTRAFAADLGRHGSGRAGGGPQRGGRRGSGKSGMVAIEAPRQEVLRRTSVVVAADGTVEARFVVGLPAQGRRVLGRQAAELLLDDVPETADAALRARRINLDKLRAHLECVEDQQALRAQLSERGLVAFVADGSRLPRASGIDPRPLSGEVVAFAAPEALAVTLDTPNAGELRGMGVPIGVTLIVGGGYHGKSTLLRAFELGVYDHIPGDGRERVVSRDDAVKIRAEDGRRVERVDISAFINNLPLGRTTTAFCTDSASGSTSQAAAIVEALEVGAGVLLLDEDTSATNFMVRDGRMQALVPAGSEPITPFIDRVRQLYEQHAVSTVVVMGGVGDYFAVADTVVLMATYAPSDVTQRARDIAEQHPAGRVAEAREALAMPSPRFVDARSIDATRGRPRRDGKRRNKTRARGTDELGFGSFSIDLGAVEQLVEPAQTRAIADALIWLARHAPDGEIGLAAALDQLQEALNEGGLDALGGRSGALALPRRFEVAAALNRLRSLRIKERG